MAIVRELVDGQSFQSDLNDRKVGVRRFAVLQCQNAYAAAMAFEAEPTAATYPGFINPRTNGPLLKLYSYSMSSEGGMAVWFIDAEYRPELPFVGSKYTYEDVRVIAEVPLAVPVKITAPTGVSANDQLVYGFELAQVAEHRIHRIVKVAKKFTNEGDDTVLRLDYISTQLDKLHSIFGKLHRLVSAIVTPDDSDRLLFTITYEWELDLGTPYPDQPIYQTTGDGETDQSIDVTIVPDPTDPPSPMWRPPYSVLRPYNPNPATFPKATVIQPYTVVPDGWLQLPGIDTI